jgi:hypothetical protein
MLVQLLQSRLKIQTGHMKQFKTTVKHPPRVETGWVMVVDDPINGQLQYLSLKMGCIHWTNNNLDALRFARRQDAIELAAMYFPLFLKGNQQIRFEEHQWI